MGDVRLLIVGRMITGEITEAEQRRLDRYKQRRDEYIRRLAEALSDDPEGVRTWPTRRRILRLLCPGTLPAPRLEVPDGEHS